MRGTTEYWMEDVETASRPDLAKVQLEKLKKVLGYCQSRSKFYQKKFSLRRSQYTYNIGNKPFFYSISAAAFFYEKKLLL